jgi:hypothetical protein
MWRKNEKEKNMITGVKIESKGYTQTTKIFTVSDTHDDELVMCFFPMKIEQDPSGTYAILRVPVISIDLESNNE